MKIHKLWIEEWMAFFGIEGKATDILEYLNKDEDIDGERQIRVIMAVETEQDVVVFKLVHESRFNKELIESQIEFSQKLREAGVNTTYQYRTEAGYVKEVMLEGFGFCLTCEAFIGSEPEALTVGLEYEIGKIIGKMHRISGERQMEIGFSRVYHEVMMKSSYRKVWGNKYPTWVEKAWIDDMAEKHDSLMEAIQSEFAELPKAAVQGDVFGLNNVAVTEKGIAIYDYNLASDEVLVGDFLMCWYRTIADKSMHEFLNESNVQMMWEAYAAGYLESRSLSRTEYAVGYKLCAVLGLIHMTKLAIELNADGRKSDAQVCLLAGERLLERPRWLKEYGK